MSLRKLKFPPDSKLTLPPLPSTYLECSWIDSEISTETEFVHNPPLSITNVQKALVHQARVLTSGEDVKQKIEVLFNTEGFDCCYVPGDTIGVYPLNPLSEVENLLDLLDLNEFTEKYFKIDISKNSNKKNPSLPKHLPNISKLKDTFLKYLEIRSPVKKLFIRSLSHYTEDTNERRRLEELSSKEGSDDYNKYILCDNVTLLDILKQFKTCKPPLPIILEHLPGIKPRVYSLASSPILHGKQVRIVVTIVKNDSGAKGICSGYLYEFVSNFNSLENQLELLNISGDEEQLQQPITVSMFFRQPNNFRYPNNTCVNLILIGAGSGVAPFLGFLEHNQALKCSVGSSFQTWLFFGCRNNNDYIYRKELESFVENGIITKLFVSFSRMSSETSSPKYVQDYIVSIKEDFINLLVDNETYLYICGDAQNMQKEVVLTIKSCLQSVKGIDKSKADSQIEDLIKSGSILIDSWL